MRTIVYLIVLVLINVSCQTKTIVPKPKQLISESEMTDILVDYFLAKGYNDNSKKDRHVLSQDEVVDPSAYIYKKYSIDSLVFAQNMNYYLSQEETIIAIFTRAEDKLKAKEALYTANIHKADSLKKIKNKAKLKTLEIDHKLEVETKKQINKN